MNPSLVDDGREKGEYNEDDCKRKVNFSEWVYNSVYGSEGREIAQAISSER